MSDNFSNISEIINGILNTDSAKSALKISTIFSFWGQIVGKKFVSTSKPLSISNGKMHIVCENSFVVQELLMHKNTLLKKLLPYCTPLGVQINDLIFSYKNWRTDEDDFQSGDDFPDFYSDEQLSKVIVDTDEYEKAFRNIDSSLYLSDEQKEKFKNKIIKLKRAKKIRFS